MEGGNNICAIIDAVYIDFPDKFMDPAYLCDRAILCPTHDVMLTMVPGQARVPKL